ncbi:hypothetical protein XELAEV_18014663mg [Xenopus laevis]|nr:hypothetical protein XELAEV_18014663mg [Xenopus laevis]
MMLTCCLGKLNKAHLLGSLLSMLILLENTSFAVGSEISSTAHATEQTTATQDVTDTPTIPITATSILSSETQNTERSAATTEHNTVSVDLTQTVTVSQNSTDLTTLADIHSTTISETFTPSAPNATTLGASLNPNMISDSSDSSTATATILFIQNSSNIPETTYSSTLDSTQPTVETESQKNSTEPVTVTCSNLRNHKTNAEVVCFEYQEKVKCDDLLKLDQGDTLRSVLCNVTNSYTSQCHLSLYTSETNQNCILWVLKGMASKDAKEALESHYSALQKKDFVYKWEQISDHQTKTKKTLIALVTVGVLMAFIIVTGYYLSNRESWTPGRQRLGEDPYYTETDSQGNTLVSVSAHNQEKANNETRENGTGQASTPTTTNGHSAKKQTMSDTKV